MGVRGAGSSLVPKRANCQVLESIQDLSLGLGILTLIGMSSENKKNAHL